MAIEFKHTTEAVGTNAGNGEINKEAWNENHTLTAAANTLLGFDGTGAAEEVARPAGSVVGTTATQDLSNKNYREKDTEITGTTPSLSGTGMRFWTLTGNSTPTDGMSNGDSLTISILDGSGYSITWTMVDKVIGSLPLLDPTEENIAILWKSNNKVYLAFSGEAVDA